MNNVCVLRLVFFVCFLNNIKERAYKVNKEALDIEKAVDAAAKARHAVEKEVQKLQSLPGMIELRNITRKWILSSRRQRLHEV